jgi:hypothetical protein
MVARDRPPVISPRRGGKRRVRGLQKEVGFRNAKGDRHCCQSPCHRTSASHPEGPVAWFRRHAPLAPARACELRVGHRGRLILPYPETWASFPAIGGPLHDLARRRSHKALLDAVSRSIHRLRLSLTRWPSPWVLSSGRSFRRSAACAGLSPSVSSIRRILRLGRRFRASSGIGFHPASASLDIAAMLAHRLDPVTTDAFASPSRSSAVSRRHHRSFKPCKSLILLWFPAAEPPSLQD